MKVAVDLDRCQGNGVCAGKAPEVFEVGPDGRAVVVDREPRPHLHRSLRDAVRRCPTQAITVEA
ncbi:MAG TPA: ferredoxin [Acidimicrobiales bacterium]|nr:ferredoxin [Acidimicrobiales bacterium]